MKGEVMTPEAVDCRRFLGAWARFQSQQQQCSPIDAPVDVVAQYRLMAAHFQRMMQEQQDNEELKALEHELAPAIREIDALVDEVEPHSSGICGRLPRATEIAKRKEARAHAVRSSTERSKMVQEGVAERKTQSSIGSSTSEKQEAASTPASMAENSESPIELDDDDFKAMLATPEDSEEKLSTKAMRKRLGLTDRSGADRASASETVAREEQESIQSDMMSLAKQLKDRTQTINQSLAEDVKILDAVGESAESNTALLDRENTMLKQQLASSIGLWTSLWLMAMLVIVFIATYLYMKLFSRRW